MDAGVLARSFSLLAEAIVVGKPCCVGATDMEYVPSLLAATEAAALLSWRAIEAGERLQREGFARGLGHVVHEAARAYSVTTPGGRRAPILPLLLGALALTAAYGYSHATGRELERSTLVPTYLRVLSNTTPQDVVEVIRAARVVGEQQLLDVLEAAGVTVARIEAERFSIADLLSEAGRRLPVYSMLSRGGFAEFYRAAERVLDACKHVSLAATWLAYLHDVAGLRDSWEALRLMLGYKCEAAPSVARELVRLHAKCRGFCVDRLEVLYGYLLGSMAYGLTGM